VYKRQAYKRKKLIESVRASGAVMARAYGP